MVFNLSGTLNGFRALLNPRLCLPEACVSNFNELSIPLKPDIKAVILDKDNCFAAPNELEVWCEYGETWEKLRNAYPGNRLLIVSNTAGTNDDIGFEQARKVEKNTKVAVFKHSVKKPGCHGEIMKYLYDNKIVTGAHEVAVIGDRIFTDIVMANMMGASGYWIRDGVKNSNNPLVNFEKMLYKFLKHKK